MAETTQNIKVLALRGPGMHILPEDASGKTIEFHEMLVPAMAFQRERMLHTFRKDTSMTGTDDLGNFRAFPTADHSVATIEIENVTCDVYRFIEESILEVSSGKRLTLVNPDHHNPTIWISYTISK